MTRAAPALIAPHAWVWRLPGSSIPRSLRLGRFALVAQFPGLAKVDAYARLLEHLERRFQRNGTNFVVFAYDWRLSCAVNAKLLAQRIRPVLQGRRRLYPGRSVRVHMPLARRPRRPAVH